MKCSHESAGEKGNGRVLLAESQPDVRSALRLLLEGDLGMTVVGEISKARELTAQVGQACPNLLLIAWEMIRHQASDILLNLRSLCPDACIIILSSHPEDRQAALAAGADAFVCKGDSPEHLLAAISSSLQASSSENSLEEIY